MPLLSFVIESAASAPARAPNSIATSFTVLPIGPAVSCVEEIGMIPERLTKPTVGFNPTMPFTDAGHVTEPSVSVPTATAQRFAATAAPEPALEPQGL